jgi:hypothetical protein
MGIQQTIFSTIKTALENDSVLSNYVNVVYDGIRNFDESFVPDTVKNYIVMEPLNATEEFPNGRSTLINSGIEKVLTMEIGIIGVITAIKNDKFSFVTDEGKNKGILGLDEDIKNALDNSSAVQSVVDGKIEVSTQSFIFETFPKRKVVINLTIERTFRKGER